MHVLPFPRERVVTLTNGEGCSSGQWTRMVQFTDNTSAIGCPLDESQAKFPT